MHFLCFFFQAEDGIRYLTVTGVQTCALPISFHLGLSPERDGSLGANAPAAAAPEEVVTDRRARLGGNCARPVLEGEQAEVEIGRASCRERVEISVVAVSLKKKHQRVCEC